MNEVKLNLASLSVPAKIELAETIVTRMTANPAFPTPLPALAAVTTAATALAQKAQSARTAKLAAATAFSEQDAAEDALDGLLTQLGGYVGTVANGNKDIVRSAGMSVRAEPTKPVALPAPVIKSATVGAQSGSVDLDWMRLDGAKVYVIEHTPDLTGQTNWTNGADFTRQRGTVSGLKPGSRYLFRVAAVNALGKGPWSQTVEQLAAL